MNKVVTKKVAIHEIMDHYIKITQKIIDSDYSTAINFMLLQSIVNPANDKKIIKILSDFLNDVTTLENISNIDLEFYKKSLKDLRSRVRKRKKIR